MKKLVNFKICGRLLRVALGCIALIMVFLGHSHIRVHAASQNPGTYVESNDLGTQMANYLKDGRYDDAVRVGLQAIKNQPDDEIIYNGIAVVYLARAEKDTEHRQQWVKKAVSYTEKGLSLNSRAADVGGVLLFQHARSFERAGELATTERCDYFERARRLLEERIALLQGKQLTIEGKNYPLAPLREENDKALAKVKTNAGQFGCAK
jgi:tetratricopeptide (TPR) repeat protein